MARQRREKEKPAGEKEKPSEMEEAGKKPARKAKETPTGKKAGERLVKKAVETAAARKIRVVRAKRIEIRAIAKKGEKPPREKKPGVPSWVELKPQEAVEAIVNLANAGHSASEIGMLLRDQYGVPNVKALAGKSVSRILAGQKLLPEVPEDLMNLIRKSVNLRRHLERNKKDFSAKRGLQLAVAKIRRLVSYYKKEGRLPLDWRYSEETAALLVK